MTLRLFVAIVFTLLAGSSCAQPDRSGDAPADTTKQTAAVAPATFVNKVWAVGESKQVELGALRVFLAEGTLVMASPHGTPAFGTWSYRDGRLTVVEDGQSYPVDILELNDTTFRIRIGGPGYAVEIRFVPAGPSSGSRQ